jgi:glucoamylase
MQMMHARVRNGVTSAAVAALVTASGILVPPAIASAASSEAPGAPGAASDWVTGDKDGFGTAQGTTSKVWYTLNSGELSEIYYPRIDTPSTRDTQLVVTDGRTFTDRETTDTIHQIRLLDAQSLIYQQTGRAQSGRTSPTRHAPRFSWTSSSAPSPGTPTRSTCCTTPP